MCDYSLHHVKSRPAKVGDKLTTHNFNTGTCGFAAPEIPQRRSAFFPKRARLFRRSPMCILRTLSLENNKLQNGDL